MSELEIIPLKNNLLVDFKHTEIKNKIIARLTELNLNEVKYKCDAEFLSLVCNLAEHLVAKKDKIKKKELVITIFNCLFGLSAEEQDLISKNIEFLHSQRNIIKKVSFYKLFKTSVRELFFKKR